MYLFILPGTFTIITYIRVINVKWSTFSFNSFSIHLIEIYSGIVLNTFQSCRQSLFEDVYLIITEILQLFHVHASSPSYNEDAFHSPQYGLHSQILLTAPGGYVFVCDGLSCS